MCCFSGKLQKPQMHLPDRARSAEQWAWTWRPVQFHQWEEKQCRMWFSSSWGLGSSETPSALAAPLLIVEETLPSLSIDIELPAASVYLAVKWKTSF